MKRQFREDYKKWKNQKQAPPGSAAPPYLLSGAEVGNILNFKQSRNETSQHLQQNLLSQQQQPEEQQMGISPVGTSETAEFLNPNHFRSIADSMYKARCTPTKFNNEHPAHAEGPPVRHSKKPSEKIGQKVRSIPATSEDDPYMSYVKTVELDVDSHPCDQFKITSTYDCCHEAYMRLLSKFKTVFEFTLFIIVEAAK